MGIEPKFTQAQIKARIDNFLNLVEKKAVERLQYLGEQCVQRARLNGDYMDQTGNLRSSVGYMIFKDGQIQHQSFEQTKNGLNGTNQGRSLAIKVGSQFGKGICLVVVAGMNYALAVESRGRDVLTSTEVFAKQELPKMLAQLKQNINSAID